MLFSGKWLQLCLDDWFPTLSYHVDIEKMK